MKSWHKWHKSMCYNSIVEIRADDRTPGSDGPYECRPGLPGVLPADDVEERKMLLKSCCYCGGIHSFGEACPKREAARQKRREEKNQKCRERNSSADRFRNTFGWRKKRWQIRVRDMHMCRYCFIVNHRIRTSPLSVHHIIPIEQAYDKRYADDNLITLCRECHELAEKGEIPVARLKSLVHIRMKLN